MRTVKSHEACIGMKQNPRTTSVEAEHPGRKTDAELQHLHPDGAGRSEVAQFVDHHQDQQQRGKSAHGEQKGFHRQRLVGPAPPITQSSISLQGPADSSSRRVLCMKQCWEP